METGKKQYLKWFVAVALFAGAMVAVWLLYGLLSDQYATGGLVVQNGGAAAALPSKDPSDDTEASDDTPDTENSEGTEGTEGTANTEDAENTEDPSGGDGEQAVSYAPDFTVYDKDGNAVKLSDLRGKPVVLNFWASWCGPCKAEMPAFQQIYEKYEGKVEFMMVNLTDGARETVEGASAFIQKQGYTFPLYFDTEMQAAIAYSVYSIPVTCFIGENGEAVAYGNRRLSADELEIGISMIYDGK